MDSSWTWWRVSAPSLSVAGGTTDLRASIQEQPTNGCEYDADDEEQREHRLRS
jgi:hypothetical protein